MSLMTIVAGPSGVGKSTFSYSLANELNGSVLETDDLFGAVVAQTSSASHPELHYFEDTLRDPPDSAQETLLHFLALCRAFAPSIRAVVNLHLETRTPLIIEGDHILPELAAEFSGQLSVVYLVESDEGQIAKNYLNREPEAGDQSRRAHVSWLFGQYLKQQCTQFDIACVEVQPWDTLSQRTRQKF